MPENKKKTRGNLAVMGRLVGLVKPLAPVMVAAVLLGVAGFLCAIFITVLGAYALLDSILPGMPISLGTVCLLLPVLAIARGVLHYAEQGCNHFIAFKLLALIRDKVFGALRQLAPAKLEGRDRGDLIAVLTADIELLEVFYAHTISPICIAVIVSAIMAAFLSGYHWLLGLYALGAYLVIGLLVPVAAAKSARRSGEEFRASFGALNGFVLDSLRGVRESLQYGDGPHRLAQINARTDKLSSQERRLKLAGGTAQAVTGGIILLLDAGMLALAAGLAQSGTIGFDGCLNFFAGPTDKQFSAKMNFYDVHYNSTHVMGTTGGNTADMIESLELTASGRIDPAVWMRQPRLRSICRRFRAAKSSYTRI